MTKKFFWATVALDEGGSSWIIEQSLDAKQCDLLLECSADDNGFDRDWDKGLSPGVYRVILRPWGYDDDTGIDVLAVWPLWLSENKFETPESVDAVSGSADDQDLFHGII